MHRLPLYLLVTAAVILALPRPAAAIPQFQQQFLKEYIRNHENAEYATFVKRKVTCLICHQGKALKYRKYHNNYGKHLVERLDKKEDARNVEKILAALREVAKLPYDPEDENSETFGERIAAGKLPGADTLEELQAPPKEAEEENAKEAAE